jgi:7-keto-8-aminopelargonate synthetase-like enzyme
MDGDTIDLHAMVKNLGDDDVLLVDEAHALGVLGPRGAGLAFGIDDPRIVVMGTLSKALGALGGFIAGPERFVQLLANTARTFIFDTALPPSIALAGRVALSIARKADDRRATLHENAKYLRSALQKIGIGITGDAISHIVPIVLGDEERALRIGVELLQKRIYAPPIRPPTVPAGTSRLRVSLRSDHTLEHIELLVSSLQQCLVGT